MNHLLFSPKMKLADIISTNYKLLLVLSRFNIHLGFGEKSVEEICNKQNIPVSLFLQICNVHTFEDYLPKEDELQTFGVDSLIAYLQTSHLYYTGKCLPGIKQQLNLIAQEGNSKPTRILQGFYEDYQCEVLKHFNYEETIVFPYIRQIIHGSSTKAYSITQFEKNHSNIDEKLNDLKNIIIKYLPDTGLPEELNSLLFQLFELENDFLKHTLIEDKILVPLVLQLEQKQ